MWKGCGSAEAIERKVEGNGGVGRVHGFGIEDEYFETGRRRRIQHRYWDTTIEPGKGFMARRH